jgi:hypothetical protein
VIGIPEPRVSNSFSVTVAPEPTWRGRIEQWLIVVAQKGYRISLDESAPALWCGLIFNGEPEKRRLSDDLADFALEGALTDSHFRVSCIPYSPSGKLE